MIRFDLTLKDGGYDLVPGRDYTEVYENNLNAGKATFKAYGRGKYTGVLVKSFKIARAANPMTVTAKTVRAYSGKNTAIAKSKAFAVKKAKGTVTFKKASGSKKITILNQARSLLKRA